MVSSGGGVFGIREGGQTPRAPQAGVLLSVFLRFGSLGETHTEPAQVLISV